jgi:hypothetical protein
VWWLWQDRIPLGSLSLIGGREGIGKSTVAYTIVAGITRGRLAGEHAGQPRSVIVAATEDSWAHTIVPRLMAAGADLDRVFKIDVMTCEGVETGLVRPGDLRATEDAVCKVDAAVRLPSTTTSTRLPAPCSGSTQHSRLIPGTPGRRAPEDGGAFAPPPRHDQPTMARGRPEAAGGQHS